LGKKQKKPGGMGDWHPQLKNCPFAPANFDRSLLLPLGFDGFFPPDSISVALFAAAGVLYGLLIEWLVKDLIKTADEGNPREKSPGM